ncbi:CHAT domain-containing protein [Streptomyces sp. NBC_01768]|uniref:CHAT domain-containing protein n=1 Tax=Streptomyces sp. NBC_01768 TaxID=2975938 RepID=UPI002DDC27B3|nr:CHAT domain-containing protein [Streptomyces sp. NBC_01768]WSC25668.1 CHAT domain-containing protein [Streptomyces sp. NBC_01768]
MSDQASGGVQGLRTWSAEAAERVRELIPAMGARAVPPAAYDRSIGELDQLVRLLDHDPVLRGAVSVWLGGALALRLSTGAGTDTDRERAERLLRDARDRRTALGATVGTQERRWAALFLLTLLTPMRSQPGAPGNVPDLAAFVDWFTRSGPDGVMTFATEIHELTDDIAELPLPPEFLTEYRRLRELFSASTGPDFTEILANVMPVGDPFADVLRQTMGRMFNGGGPGAEGPEGAAADGAGGERDTRAAPAEEEGAAAPAAEGDAAPAPDPEPEPPLALGDIRRIAAALDAVNATTHGFDEALRNGDPQALNEMLRKLRSVQDMPPPGLDPTPGIEALMALLLNVSAGVGGTIQDQSTGRAHVDAVARYFENYGGPLPPGFRDPAVLGRAQALYAKVLDAGDAEDGEALRGLVDDAEELARTAPEGHPFRFVVELTLGAALTRLGAVIGDLELIRRGTPFLEQGMAGARAVDFPFAEATPLPTGPDFALLRAALSGGTAPGVDHVPPPADASTDEVYSAALSAGLQYALTRDQAVLDMHIDELERVRDAVREGKAPRIAAEALWRLAEAYRERGVRDQDVQDIRALGAAEEALTALAADVLLQAGAEHGLLTARSGANRGVQAALWAASQGRLHEGVAVLELGRALVLHAASTSSAVPELLDADGYHELAEAWREAVAAGADGAPGDAREQGVPGELPSTLRRRALEALGYRRRGGLLGTPTPADLADGVAASGADALVYLVPGEDAEAGVAIIVSPERGLAMKVLPLLSGAENGPVERYLDATALIDAAAPDDAAAAQSWEQSLGALCDWAHDVLGPVVTALEEALRPGGDRAQEPLRVVLVPCGRLGIVPWHAARGPGGTSPAYLCRTTVFSYAASGSQFLRTVRRAPRDPAAAPVLLADPTLGLTYAEVEVLALRNAFYPGARLCGGMFEVPEDELLPGTPEEVLGFLTEGASLLHVASHGSAGVRPTVSALHLAAGPAGDPPAEADGTDSGDLTVTRLLDQPVRRQATADGPLVVLSACRTDLSTRDHDEALTLTTAFVSGGARDVVGSRWAADDGTAALLMAVFHHYLNAEGLSPVDALRAAQLWMLDPGRETPGSLSGVLLRQAERTDLDRVPLWAAFIHQGHPGPAGTRKTSEGGGPDEHEW